MKTRHLQLVTSTHSVTTTITSSVRSPYGPVKAGLTTSQTTNDQRLMELLNSLESVVDNLNFRSFTLYDTLNTAIEEVSVALLATQIDVAGTDLLD